MLWSIFIGLFAGFFAGKLLYISGYRFFSIIVVGILGSYIGAYAFRVLGLTAGGTIGQLITATVSTLIFLVAWISFSR